MSLGLCMLRLPDSVIRLTELVNQDAHNELECRKFLPLISPHLCHQTANRIIRIGEEQPNRFGSWDFVVSAEITHGGLSEVIAYVWELKAPQVYLYELDANLRRFRPTPDLVRAETQLLHYVWEAQDSRAFRDYFGLGASSKILPAGIIIGRQDRLAKVASRANQEVELDEIALARQSDFPVRTSASLDQDLELGAPDAGNSGSDLP
jgi:hypothetical protein